MGEGNAIEDEALDRLAILPKVLRLLPPARPRSDSAERPYGGPTSLLPLPELNLSSTLLQFLMTGLLKPLLLPALGGNGGLAESLIERRKSRKLGRDVVLSLPGEEARPMDTPDIGSPADPMLETSSA